MLIYRVKIEEIKGDRNPYEVIFRRYDTENPIILPTGQEIQNDILKGQAYLFDSTGDATKPEKGDQAIIFQINSTEYLALCVDWGHKPQRQTNERCLGNFKTSNFIRINDDTILIQESGTKNLYVDIASITFKSTIEHIVETQLLQILSQTTSTIESKGDMTVESTGGKTSLDASTTVELGGSGGSGVARIGDSVDMVPASPTYGKIITGSSKVLST